MDKNARIALLIPIMYLWICSPLYCNDQPLNSRQNIAILKTESKTPSVADTVSKALEREGFNITFLSAKDACDPKKLNTGNYFLYVIPNPEKYPKNGEKALTQFIQNKGNLLVLGKPELPGQPLLETVSPSYKMYPMHDIASLKISDDQGILTETNLSLPVPQSASSCFRRPTGKGFESGYSFRWIPVIDAIDSTGLDRGTAAWMLINQAPLKTSPEFSDALRRLVATTQGNKQKEQLSVEGSAFAVCAITDNDALLALAKTPLFGNMAKRMAKGVYLSHAGSDHFSYWPDEIMQMGAAVVNYGVNPAQTKVTISVSNTEGMQVYKSSETFNINPGETVKKAMGEIPANITDQGYRIRTELVSDGEIIDVITHEIGILSTDETNPADFITTRDTQFRLHNRQWNPVGANYWPRNAIATEQIDYLYHWLTPGYYDPEQLDDDLQRLQDMGCNFIAIRAHYTENRRTLLDFLRRCLNHDIYVFLFLQQHEVTVEPHYFQGIMMPFLFETDKVTDFIKETRITNNPAVMAWDLIWEPSVWLFQDNVTMFGWDGNPNLRDRWDDDWLNWIDERYGSLANAETDWGVPAPRRADGHVTSPADSLFEKDGPWRVMVSAYRRFMSDLMNHYWNDTYRQLKKLDPNHLISYRQGNLPPNDFTLTSTLKHVDYYNMEGYSFPPKENGVNKAGFVNRYLCYVFDDKPFMWNEYGYGGPWGKYTHHLDGEDLVYQGEYVEMINSLAYKNGANGIAPWWFPGGLRASEKTDFGITTPEGTLRPSGESMKKYAAMYRNTPPERPVPNEWFTFDTDAHSGGLWYVAFNDGADAYEQATTDNKTLGVKTPGTGTTSANTPLLAVGNTKYNDKNPPKYLNAEFNQVRLYIGDKGWVTVGNGDTVRVSPGVPILARISVGNLEQATWLTSDECKGQPGAVFLASTGKSKLACYQGIEKNTPWLHDSEFDFQLTNGISGNTPVELRMRAEDRAWFGEIFRFTLVTGE